MFSVVFVVVCLRRSVVDSVCVVFVLFCALDVWSDVVDGTTTGVVGDVEGGGDDVARAGNGKLFVGLFNCVVDIVGGFVSSVWK